MRGADPSASAVTGVVNVESSFWFCEWEAEEEEVGRCIEEMWFRWDWVEDLKGNVGKSCRRYRSHCSTAGRGTKSATERSALGCADR